MGTASQPVTFPSTGNAAIAINDPLLSIAKGGVRCAQPLPNVSACWKELHEHRHLCRWALLQSANSDAECHGQPPGSPQEVSLTAQVIDPLALPHVAN